MRQTRIFLMKRDLGRVVWGGKEKKKHIRKICSKLEQPIPDSTHGLCARIDVKLFRDIMFRAMKHMPTGSLRPMKM